ncbi:MAG: hypothetical protein KKB31_06315 [Nanoarchaeota archaeon]|nr:hypothetical protein [Nanoarchaeota archaeon]
MKILPPTVYEIITCKCGEKYITTEGTDNVYHCLKCGENLVEYPSTRYEVENSQLIKFIETHFQEVEKSEPQKPLRLPPD